MSRAQHAVVVPDDLVPVLVRFAERLRDADVPASPDRVHAFLRALDAIGASDPADVYWTGRITFCADPIDLPRYDRVFGEVFGGALHGETSASRTVVRVASSAGDDDGDDGEEADEAAEVTGSASRAERLRHRDVTELTDDERADLHRLLTTLRLPGEARVTRRYRRAHHGVLDQTATVRRLLRSGGEPARLAHRRHRTRPRRVALLVDVSGSMEGYADALLRFAHATVRSRTGGTEVFTLGTRLTRVSRELRLRDPDMAMRAVADAVSDWSGGTRLGDTLKEFLDSWGQRGVARGAVVVVLSDGWERGDVTMLRDQMVRLQRLAHRVVWANPRAGAECFQPIARGMAAALESCDDLVAGHSLAALEHLARVVAGAVAPSPPAQPPVPAPI